MTKIQKVWLWVFLGLFIVPEVLWSPVVNYAYTILQYSNEPHFFRTNIFFGPYDDYHKSLALIIFVQFIGILVSGVLVLKFAKFKWKNIASIVLLILAAITSFIFYLVYSTISFWR